MDSYEFKKKYISEDNVILPNDVESIDNELKFHGEPPQRLDLLPNYIKEFSLQYAKNPDISGLHMKTIGRINIDACGLTEFAVETLGTKIISLTYNALEEIPEVLQGFTGSLNLSGNKIKSLKNLPIKANNVVLDNNQITSTKGLANFCGQLIDLEYNPITEFEGLPRTSTVLFSGKSETLSKMTLRGSENLTDYNVRVKQIYREIKAEQLFS